MNGPLLHLSLRRVGAQCGPRHTPAPPSNEQRVAAYRAFQPMQPNAYPWAWTERERYAREAAADGREFSTDDY